MAALFLPIRRKPEELAGRPIHLAWNSSHKAHYIPLIGVEGAEPPTLYVPTPSARVAMLTRGAQPDAGGCIRPQGGRRGRAGTILQGRLPAHRRTLGGGARAFALSRTNPRVRADTGGHRYIHTTETL